MRNTLFLLAAGLWLVSPAFAEQTGTLKFESPANAKPLPVKQPKSVGSSACAAYGAGFMKVAGSDTCVKIGGSISIGVTGR